MLPGLPPGQQPFSLASKSAPSGPRSLLWHNLQERRRLQTINIKRLKAFAQSGRVMVRFLLVTPMDTRHAHDEREGTP